LRGCRESAFTAELHALQYRLKEWTIATRQGVPAMTQVVQARCPHCQNVLRIPADWLDKAMRCKFCKNTFEARTRPGEVPAMATAIAAAPVAKVAVPVNRAALATAVGAGVPPSDPLVFSTASSHNGAPLIARPKSGGSGKVLLLVGCGVLLLIGLPATAAIALLLGGGVALWMHESDAPEVPILAKNDHGKDRIAKEGGGKDALVVGKDGIVKDPVGKDKKPPVKDKDKGGKPPVGEKFGKMPRRALLINVCNYLYLNRVDPGSKSQSTSLTALKDRGLSNPPLSIPASQIFSLSDEGDLPHPTELSVIRNAIKDFCDTSRPQDRIIILFAGHATETEKDAYLIPIGGKREDPDSMLPLAWVFDQLVACKAQQKVLILDVYRFPPARGFELPGAGASEEGEMGEVFDKVVQNPPAGVQVWSSCTNGQRSIEFEGGSVFLQALSRLREGGALMSGIASPKDPMPIDAGFVGKVNDKMKELLGPKYTQTSRLSGTAPKYVVAYDATEPQALPITLKAPIVAGDLANRGEVNSILDEIRLLPVRKSRTGEEDRLLKVDNLPPFPAKALATYKVDDYKAIAEVLKRHKDDPKGLAKQHPVRAAVLDAIDALRKGDNIKMVETLNAPINDKVKAAFFREQKDPGLLIFDLEQVVGEMKSAEETMNDETSKRWRAHFEFTRARLKQRLVYIYEYSYLLGQIRRDELPALDGGDGWRVGSQKKIQVNEQKAKRYKKEADGAWKKIQKDYPETPWSVLAYRESLVALGLEWRAKKE
jgi:hypothetical protein